MIACTSRYRKSEYDFNCRKSWSNFSIQLRSKRVKSLYFVTMRHVRRSRFVDVYCFLFALSFTNIKKVLIFIGVYSKLLGLLITSNGYNCFWYSLQAMKLGGVTSINITTVFLHSHLAGRKIKLRHIRFIFWLIASSL